MEEMNDVVRFDVVSENSEVKIAREIDNGPWHGDGVHLIAEDCAKQ
jgi:hypothetical protein